MIKKIILGIFLLTAALAAQQRGTPSQIRVRVDVNGYLLAATAAQTNPVTTVTFSQARLNVDASGNLVIVCAGCGGSSAPSNSSFITRTADSGLSNEFALGTLATGILFNTTTTGTPSVITCASAGTMLIGGAPPNCSGTGLLSVGLGIGTGVPTSVIALYIQEDNAHTQIQYENTNTGVNSYIDYLVKSGTTVASMGASNPNYTGTCPATCGLRSWIDAAAISGNGWDYSAPASNGNHIFYTAGYAAGNQRVLIDSTGLKLTNGGLLYTTLSNSTTAPTIASGGCTSPAVSHNNGTSAFLLTVGTACTGVTTITLTMPAAAHFWKVGCTNNTSAAQQAANAVLARATTTTSVILTNYAVSTGIAADFTASDTLLCSASAE